jgi:hypothetical protein
MTMPRKELPMQAINRMVNRWDANDTPIETRLEEAVHRLEKMAEDRLRLDRRIRQQRYALRENWMIVERRTAHHRAWVRSPLLISMLRNRRPPWWWRLFWPA